MPPVTYRSDSPNHLSLDAIFAMQDLHEATLDVASWSGTIRVRALSLAAQHAIRTAARRAVKKEDRERGVTEDFAVFCVETLFHGFASPRLDREQARQLLEKNGDTINEIVRFIWNELSLYDWRAIEDAARTMAGVEPPSSDD